MLTTRTVADLLVIGADIRFTPEELLDVARRSATPHTSGLVVSMSGVEDGGEEELDALVALKKESLLKWGSVRIVASPAFAEYIRRRLGPWLSTSASAVDAVRALWPETSPPAVQMVGYWPPLPRPVPGSAPADQRCPLPDPHRLVVRNWRLQQRALIAGYLRAGAVVAKWCGLSPCRFGCGAYGSTCMSDGVWQWPEGLVHYVECHSLRLPDEFVATMEGNGWSVPCEAEHGAGARSLEFWIGWAAGQGITPAEYGECVALAAHIRRQLGGEGIRESWHLSPPDARRLRDLLRTAADLGRADSPSADELRSLIAGAQHALAQTGCQATVEVRNSAHASAEIDTGSAPPSQASS
jgi:hypothetical protein